MPEGGGRHEHKLPWADIHAVAAVSSEKIRTFRDRWLVSLTDRISSRFLLHVRKNTSRLFGLTDRHSGNPDFLNKQTSEYPDFLDI